MKSASITRLFYKSQKLSAVSRSFLVSCHLLLKPLSFHFDREELIWLALNLSVYYSLAKCMLDFSDWECRTRPKARSQPADKHGELAGGQSDLEGGNEL